MLRQLLRAALTACVLFVSTVANAATVTLQWDANTEPDVLGYVVRYGGASGVYTTEIDVGLTTTWTGSFTVPGTNTYYFVVQAYNSTSRSDNSAEVSTPVTNPIPNPLLFIDMPGPSTTVPTDFLISGWSIDSGAPTGTGVDAVYVYAIPASTGTPTYLGLASYGTARPDVAGVVGARWLNCGYSFPVTALAPGMYTLALYPHSTVTNTIPIVRTVAFTVSTTAAASGPLIAVDRPSSGAVIPGALWVAGWAIDTRSSTGTGVNAVRAWAYPWPGSGAAPIFLGTADYGMVRNDLAALLGARYANSGYNLIAGGLLPAVYDIVIQARSTVTGAYEETSRVVQVNVQPQVLVSIDAPPANATVTNPFSVDGWAIDRRATTNTGVDMVQVWATANPGSGSPSTLLGTATSWARPDVAALFGSQFANSGYHYVVSGLSPGAYDIVVYAHSSVSNSWESLQKVRLTVQ